MSEQESMSEKELAEHLAETVFGDAPRSVGEALAAADTPEHEPEPEEAIEVEDVPTPPALELEEEPVAPTEPEETEEVAEEDAETDQHVVWAKKKYGEDPAQWAKAAYDQERHISRLAGEKKEAEELAGQWYEYSQQIEAQAAQQNQMGMPLSTQEEQWIENSLSNPFGYAMQAAQQSNFPLYQGVIARIAEENPLLAAQIGAQVQRNMEEAAVEENGTLPSLQETLAYSIQRLGIDLAVYGEPMSQKIGELGEHHPYVQTILEGEQDARDIALMAVYDLVRSTAMSTRKVRSEERENQIKHEAELRRQAAGVVTGGPRGSEAPKQPAFLDAMQREWEARGQWSEE